MLTRLGAKKRRRTTTSSLSILDLPDSILGGVIGGYIASSSRALLAAALSSSSSSATKINCWNEQFTTLDFSDIDDLAAKLTDDDIHSVLVRIDAATKLQTLKLAGCVNITGIGLRALRGSIALKQIDLSLVGKHEKPTLDTKPMISEEIVCLYIAPVRYLSGHLKPRALFRDRCGPGIPA